MFEKFKDTDGIIFDMRGYPRGTAWAIAPRINTKRASHAAEFRRPLVGGFGLPNGSFQFLQPIPDGGSKAALSGQDGDADRRAGRQPVGTHRPLLRGGQRHDVYRQPDHGGQRRRHHVDLARGLHRLVQWTRRPPRRRPPAPAGGPCATHRGPTYDRWGPRRARRGARASQESTWGIPPASRGGPRGNSPRESGDGAVRRRIASSTAWEDVEIGCRGCERRCPGHRWPRGRAARPVVEPLRPRSRWSWAALGCGSPLQPSDASVDVTNGTSLSENLYPPSRFTSKFRVIISTFLQMIKYI